MTEMGQVLEFKMTDRHLANKIRREAMEEAKFLYQTSAGFTGPLLPDAEMRIMFEEGMVEL